MRANSCTWRPAGARRSTYPSRPRQSRRSTSVPTVEWRLRAFTGDWRAAATPYKAWLTATRPPVSNASRPWVANIRAVVRTVPDASLLAPLAQQFVPEQTLLYLHDWRQNGYDENYPDYTPRAAVASYVSAAHALGFRVMLHTDFIGVTPSNPDYPGVQAFHVKTPDKLAPTGWLWSSPPSTPQRFAYISPASADFRSLFIARVGAAVSAVGPDALHLDISAPEFNDGNGLIEGKTFAQGSAALHEDLTTAFPSLALGGEGENDILYRYHAFAQEWALNGDAPGHPINAFIFGPTVRYYGHLSQPSAQDPSLKGCLLCTSRCV